MIVEIKVEASLYAHYIKERENKEIVESEKGFATYCFTNDGCYIVDIYVLPEFRKSGEASNMANQITEIAKSKGFNKLYGTVSPLANGSTESLKVLLAYGFKLDSSNSQLLVLKKDI